jgi:hypothetical protein
MPIRAVIADWVKFYNVGSERGHHYLGSARIYYRIGLALGQGMLELEGRSVLL